MSALDIPDEVTGLRLCKVTSKDQLVLCEEVHFTKGAQAIRTVLNRARISGPVGPVGETGDFWADLMTSNGDMAETISLSREAWNSLKNKWMRCRVWRPA